MPLTVGEQGNIARLEQMFVGGDQSEFEDFGGSQQETIRWIAMS
jgi:hypothetical protein